MGVKLDALFEQLKTPQERLYVTLRLRGLSEFAAYKAAGGKDAPRDGQRGGRQVASFHNQPHVVEVLEAAFNISQEETGYTRAKLTEMFETAYHTAETAAEMVMAAREIGKLHGLYAPQQVKVKHDHEHRLAEVQKELKNLSVRELENMIAIDADFEEVRDPVLIEDQREQA